MGRTMWVLTGVVAGLGFLMAGRPLQGQELEAGNRAAVERAALDYLEGFYEGDAAKIRRGVHPDVVKFGFFPAGDGSGYDSEPMSFDDMLAFADRVRERGSQPPEGAPKEVVLLEVLDQVAAVKVVAWWGIDYLHLARFDGEWMVIHVIWQTTPSG